MREIKFRAWGILCNCYCNDKLHMAIGLDGDIMNYQNGDGSYILEQFTGLYDCDGKEIYDGDIVEIIMPCGTPNEITDTVQYNDVYGCFFLRTRYTSVCDLIQSDYNFKIIGNIHEAH